MRLIGLRHGQSEYNLLGLCNDDPARQVKLTDLGRQQAQQAAAQLSNDNIERIFWSPLTRALQTAEIVAQSLLKTVTVEPRLADIRSGYDGRPVKDYLAAIQNDPLNTRVNDGETLLEYHQRVNRFLTELTTQDLVCVLLVAHEETLRVFKAFAEELEPVQVVGLGFENCRPYRYKV